MAKWDAGMIEANGRTAWERKYEIKPEEAVENAIAARGGQDED